MAAVRTAATALASAGTGAAVDPPFGESRMLSCAFLRLNSRTARACQCTCAEALQMGSAPRPPLLAAIAACTDCETRSERGDCTAHWSAPRRAQPAVQALESLGGTASSQRAQCYTFAQRCTSVLQGRVVHERWVGGRFPAKGRQRDVSAPVTTFERWRSLCNKKSNAHKKVHSSTRNAHDHVIIH